MNKKSDLQQQHPLALAFVGDAVQMLYVREKLVQTNLQKPNSLHNQASKVVSAVAQSKAFDAIEPTLTADEQAVAMRARNTAYSNKAKNATHEEYHKATMLEAIIGYQYLLGNLTRVHELCELALINGELLR